MASPEPPRVLVLVPEPDVDPSTTELLEVLRWIDEHEQARLEAVAWAPGARLDDLRAICPTTVVAELSRSGTSARLERGLIRVGVPAAGQHVRRRRLGLHPWADHRPDAVLLSSPRAAPILRHLPAGDSYPVSVLVTGKDFDGEDPGFLRTDDLALLLARADRYLVDPDTPAWRHLADDIGVDEARLVPHPAEVYPEPPSPPADPAGVRAELGIPADHLVVAGTGSFDRDGGADLFVRTAWLIRQRRPEQPLAFLWVGPQPQELSAVQVQHDIDHMGLHDAFHVLGEEREDALWSADVFALTTRARDEHIYWPAGLRSVPFVGFPSDATTNRLSRFAAGGLGVVVDFLDLEAMADAVVDLLGDDDRRAELARRVGARFADWYVAPQRTARLLGDVLEPRP
jgi:hypothetical protein